MKRDRNLVRTLLYLHQQLARAADSQEMNMSQYHMLHFLHEKPRRAADFTLVSKLRKPGITSMVAIIESRGWIERDLDPEDGRAQIIRITAAGLKAFVDFENQMQGALESFLGKDVVDGTSKQLQPFYEKWNVKRIERFDTWRQEQAMPDKAV
jgi:DNA-binding MarR family transcriptional regulator